MNTDTDNPDNLGFGFLIRWCLATLTGFVLSLFFIEVGHQPDLTVLEGAIGSAIVALCQAFVMRDRLLKTREWIWANVISWTLITKLGLGPIGWMTPRTESIMVRVFVGVLFGSASGFILGILQWFVLRGEIPLAQWWLVLSPLTWAFSLSIGWTIGGLLRLATQRFMGEVIGLGITWFLVSAIVGFALLSLLKQKNLYRERGTS